MDLSGSWWIYLKGETRPTNLYVLFRRSFMVKAMPDQCRVRISADALYKLYVNGAWVGRGPVRSSSKRKYYDEYDILPYMRAGENVVAAIVYMHGVPCFETLQVRGGLVAEVEITDATGVTIIPTDRSWRAQRGTAWRQDTMRISHARGFCEHYDAQAEPSGWMLPGFDDSGWEQADEVAPAGEKPWPPLVARNIPMQKYSIALPANLVRIGGASVPPGYEMQPHEDYGPGRIMCADVWEPLQGVTVAQADALLRDDQDSCSIVPEPGKAQDIAFLLDFGGEVNGYPYFEIDAPRGTAVDLAWAEALGPDGRLDHLYRKLKMRGAYGARVVLPGGKYRWESFHLAGLRYIQVVVRAVSAPVRVHQIGVRASAYAVPAQATFACSDPTLTRLFTMGCNAVHHCMDDSYLDCPQRERGQWLADAVVEGMIAYHVFGDTALWRKAMSDYGESQTPEGRIVSVYPSEWEKWIPGFACIWVHGLRRYAELTGDATLTPEMLPAVDRLINLLSRYEKDGLLRGVEGWLFFDWQAALPEECVTLMNLSYVMLLQDAAALAASMRGSGAAACNSEGVSWEQKAARWAQMATSIKQEIYAQCWDEAKGLLCDVPGLESYSEQTNGFALYIDFFTEKDAARAIEQLVAEPNDLIKVGTPYFAFWLLTPLMAARPEAAWKRVRADWGRMATLGDSTTWEHFEHKASLCHGWSAGPSLWLLTEVLGIKQLEPGCKKVRIEPWLGDLTWASGVMPTPAGALSVYVRRRADGSMAVDVSAPQGVEYEVDLRRG